MGISGIFLNSVVLVGVAGNARLGTTINKLLIWSCSLQPHFDGFKKLDRYWIKKSGINGLVF